MIERRKQLESAIIGKQRIISELFENDANQSVYIDTNSQLKYWLSIALKSAQVKCSEVFDEQIKWVLCEDVFKQTVYKEKFFSKLHILLRIINSCIQEEQLINHYFNFWSNNNLLIAKHQQFQESDKLFCSRIDFMITERCSLNCQDCLNLMQYYKNPQNYCIESMKNDIDTIANIFDTIFELRILGGEPFVNKEIYNICEYASKKNNIENIVIFTNATIMPDEQELKRISNKNCYFYISDYGVKNQKIDQIKELLDRNRYSCYIEDFSKAKWIRHSSFRNNGIRKEEMNILFEKCGGRKCPTVSNGKLFVCEYLANAFNLNAIPDSQFNYVELNVEEEREWLRNRCGEYLYGEKALPGCSFCSRLQQKENDYVKPAIQIKNKLGYKRYE